MSRSASSADAIPEFIKNYQQSSVMELPTTVCEQDEKGLDSVEGEDQLVDEDDIDLIGEGSDVIEDDEDDEDDEGEGEDGEGSDIIEEDDDEVEETSEEWKNAWDNYTSTCLENGKNPIASVAEHISGVNADVYAALMFLIHRLTVEEILDIKERVISQNKKAPKPAQAQENIPKSSDTENSKDSGPQTALIHIKKGLDMNKIKEFIIRIDAQLQERPFENLNVVTDDWASSGEFFALIPAAKKLFAKYSEAGLLGCLISHNYQEAAKKLYCVAYVKGKKSGDSIIFSGIDQHEYRSKAKASVAEYAAILKSAGIARTKKAPLEFIR